MRINEKLYFIYSYDSKQYEYTCYGLKELAYFLRRDLNNVKVSLRKIKQKKQDFIKGASGFKYIVLTEDDLRGGE